VSNTIYRQGLRYTTAGIIVWAVDIATFYLFTHIIPLDFRLATALGYTANSVTAFVFYTLWVFRGNGAPTLNTLGRYIVACIFGLILNVSFMWGLVLGVPILSKVISRIIASLLAFFINFLVIRKFVYSNTNKTI
jgi:putative flippase GtrA